MHFRLTNSPLPRILRFLRTQVQAKLHPEDDLISGISGAPAESQRAQRAAPPQSRLQPQARQIPAGRAGGSAEAPQQGELPVIAPRGADLVARAEPGVAPREAYVPPRPQTVDRKREFARPSASETKARPTFLQRLAGMARSSLSADVTPQPAYQPAYQREVVRSPEPMAPLQRAAPHTESKPEPKSEHMRIPEPNFGQTSEQGLPETNDRNQPVVETVSEPVAQSPIQSGAQPGAQSGNPYGAQSGPSMHSQESQARPTTQIEDDLLDIPAFLRRQAN